jgi:hypothetical protein
MDDNYLIVLFKNKERYKIIKKYRTYKNSFNFYTLKLKESESVVFDVQTENGRVVNYEIALIEKTSEKLLPIFKTDELGRNLSIELNDPNFGILKIEKYNIPEKIYHIDKKVKLSASKVISTFLKGDSLKLVSKLNNKIIIQDDDRYNIFSLKSISDADRFLDCLERYMIDNDKKNCLIVKDSSIEQKKYLYEVLTNLGYDKQMLYRTSTTHPKDK